jgi:hypothetical protein
VVENRCNSVQKIIKILILSDLFVNFGGDWTESKKWITARLSLNEFWLSLNEHILKYDALNLYFLNTSLKIFSTSFFTYSVAIPLAASVATLIKAS